MEDSISERIPGKLLTPRRCIFLYAQVKSQKSEIKTQIAAPTGVINILSWGLLAYASENTSFKTANQ